MTDSPGQPPTLRIVTPDATAEEIAALVTVFASLGSAPTPAKKAVSSWAAPSRRLRGVHRHGPGGWRASGLPR